MKMIFFRLLLAGLVLAACSPKTAATPEVTSVCETGTRFVPGESIILEENQDYTATLLTFGGIRPNGQIWVDVYGGGFPPSGADFPSKEGEVKTLNWRPYIQIGVGLCGGEYFYSAVVVERAEPVRDSVCGAGFGGPTKQFPFSDRILLFRSLDHQEVWLVTGIGSPVLIGHTPEGMIGVEVERPLEGQTTVSVIPAGTGTLEVAIKNCDQILYYAAVWRYGK